MSVTSMIYEIKENTRLKRRWERLDLETRRFVLEELSDDLAEKTVMSAIRKAKRRRRAEVKTNGT